MKSSLFDLKGRVIVVSGGYGYLGRAICRGLLGHNANVVVGGRDRQKFERAFSQELSAGDNISFVDFDISQSHSIESAFQEVVDRFGDLHVVVNNAFYSKGQLPEELSDDLWSLGVDGTLNSVYRSIRASIPHLRKTKGKIVNVASMYGLVSPDFSIYDDYQEYLNPPHYGASKAGILQLTRYFAGYLGKDGICVNAVTPGPFPSDEVQGNEGFIELLKKRTMLGRIGSPADLAGAFVYLSSSASDFLTGQNIIIDGGWTAR